MFHGMMISAGQEPRRISRSRNIGEIPNMHVALRVYEIPRDYSPCLDLRSTFAVENCLFVPADCMMRKKGKSIQTNDIYHHMIE